MTDTVNASMYSGDSLAADVTITDSDGNSVSLTDATITYVIADAGGNILVSKTVGNGIEVSGNVATVTLAPTDTESLNGYYYHEMEVTDINGNVSTVFVGALTIHRDTIQ